MFLYTDISLSCQLLLSHVRGMMNIYLLQCFHCRSQNLNSLHLKMIHPAEKISQVHVGALASMRMGFTILDNEMFIFLRILFTLKP